MDQTETVKIIGTIMTILILVITWKLLGQAFDYLRNHPFFKPNTLVPSNCNQFLFYLCYFRSVFKLSRPTVPVLTLAMQAACGACWEVFEKRRIFSLYVGLKPGIFLFKPETVEAVCSSSTLIEKSTHYKVVHSWLGTGLFSSPGEKWRKHRKMLTPTFHFSVLETFIPIFQEQSDILVSKLKDLTREPWVDIVPLVTLCTLDIICQTAMGVKLHAQRNENKEYVKAVHDITDAVINREFRPWLFLDTIYYMTTEGKKYRSNLQIVHGFTGKVTKEKMAEMIELRISKYQEKTAQDSEFKVPKRKPFLEFLLEYHFQDPSFTEEDIREEVDTFMFGGYDATAMGISWILYCIGLYPEVQKKIHEELEDIFDNDSEREVTREDLTKMRYLECTIKGYDTTAMGISWILYCIGLYPEVQKKVHEELDEIFQDDPERDVTREDLTKMKYMECTIKETFRLYPPAPFFMRECIETMEILGHTIHPGSFLLVLTCALHRDKKSFPDPEKFIPERFSPENSKGRHPYAYIPFSAGPRNCIGQKFAMLELKIMAANILRCLKVTSLDPRDKVNVAPNLTLQNTEPLRLRFEMR